MSIVERGCDMAQRAQTKVKEHFDPMVSDRTLCKLVRQGRTPDIRPAGEAVEGAAQQYVITTPPPGCSWHSGEVVLDSDSGTYLFTHARSGRQVAAKAHIVGLDEAHYLQYRIGLARHIVAGATRDTTLLK